jgi:hypothetical protein
MKDWFIVLSIVWLMTMAGILFLGRPLYLFDTHAQPAFIDPTPMPGTLGGGFRPSVRVFK